MLSNPKLFLVLPSLCLVILSNSVEFLVNATQRGSALSWQLELMEGRFVAVAFWETWLAIIQKGLIGSKYFLLLY